MERRRYSVVASAHSLLRPSPHQPAQGDNLLSLRFAQDVHPGAEPWLGRLVNVLLRFQLAGLGCPPREPRLRYAVVRSWSESRTSWGSGRGTAASRISTVSRSRAIWRGCRSLLSASKWAREAESKASIELNPEFIQRGAKVRPRCCALGVLVRRWRASPGVGLAHHRARPAARVRDGAGAARRRPGRSRRRPDHSIE
jgi:hypothetical protein